MKKQNMKFKTLKSADLHTLHLSFGYNYFFIEFVVNSKYLN